MIPRSIDQEIHRQRQADRQNLIVQMYITGTMLGWKGMDMEMVQIWAEHGQGSEGTLAKVREWFCWRTAAHQEQLDISQQHALHPSNPLDRLHLHRRPFTGR